MHEFILSQFVTLWEEYDRARALVPRGNLVEVSYEALAADPVGTVGSIYSALGIAGFEERVKPALQREVTRLADYQPNEHAPLPTEGLDFAPYDAL